MKLRQKLFIILLFMALLPTLCMTAVSYYRYQKTVQQQMTEYSSNLFSRAVQQTNTTLAELERLANQFSSYSSGNHSLIRNLKPYADSDEAHDELSIYQSRQSLKYLCQNLFNTYDYIYGIYFFTPSGIHFTFENTADTKLVYGYTPADEAWYQEVIDRRGKLYISGISSHPDIFQSQKQSFFLAKNLYDIYTSKSLGVLMINCDPGIFDLDALNTIPDVTSISIINHDRNETLYCTASDGRIPAPEEAGQLAAYAAELTHPSLTLYTFVDHSRLYREFSATGILLILIALFCVVSGIFLALYFSKSVTGPIVHLSRKMSRQSEENLSISTRCLNRTDEIGVLYNEYNSMIEELNTAIKTNYQSRLISLDAQMKSLEARINSHFLFNTLEAINSIAVMEGSRSVSTMAMSLGNMFRYAIKTPSEIVTLQDEINHVLDYISIQSIRFDGLFQFRLRVPESMKRLKVLKLILQPLVENAFSHGLQNCQFGHRISIRGFLYDACFYIYVMDDGKGMSSEQLRALNDSLREEPAFTELGHRSSQSIGLKNINTRIELYYGKGYGLYAESKPNRGTLIRIKLPCLHENNAAGPSS
nr:sensor histidine kinase [uncultured Schaedlerella sp.]